MPLSQPGKVIIERAEVYDSYRLPYSTEAVNRLMGAIGRPLETIADIGAGTGLLTRLFEGRATRVWAIDPEPAMLEVASRHFAASGSVTVAEGLAEHTGLPGGSVDLIVVGNAYHRFDPQPTISEFDRILRESGWLAIFGYGWVDSPLNNALGAALGGFRELRGRMARTRHAQLPSVFFGGGEVSEILEPQMLRETWDEFWGGLSSGMESPTVDDPWYGDYRAAIRTVFDSHSVDGVVEYHYATSILLGQPKH